MQSADEKAKLQAGNSRERSGGGGSDSVSFGTATLHEPASADVNFGGEPRSGTTPRVVDSSRQQQRQQQGEEEEQTPLVTPEGRSRVTNCSGRMQNRLSAQEISELEVGECLEVKYFDMTAKHADAMLTSGVWKTAKVMKNNTRRHPGKIKVSFQGLGSKHDCWIDHRDAKRFGGLASKV